MEELHVPLFVLGSVTLITLGVFLVVVLAFVPFAINMKVDPDYSRKNYRFWALMGVWTSRWFMIVGTIYAIFLFVMVLVTGSIYMNGVLS